MSQERETNDAWTEHEVAQLRRWAELSLKQRLDWLSQAKAFAAKAAAAAAEQRRGTARAVDAPNDTDTTDRGG